LSATIEGNLPVAARTGDITAETAHAPLGMVDITPSSRDAFLCAGLILASAIFFFANAFLLVTGKPFDVADLAATNTSDFFVYFSAARMMLAETPIAQLYDFEGFRAFQASLADIAPGYHPFVYPPTYLLAILPLGLLPYGVSFVAWQTLGLSALIVAARLAGLRFLEIAAVALAPAATINFAAGQNGFLTSALLIAGLALLQRRPALAGGLFGLLTLKFHLGLLLPVMLVGRRAWAAILGAAFVAVALVGLSLWAFGPEAWIAFLDFARQFQEIAVSQEIRSLAANAISPFVGLAVAGAPLVVAYAVQAAVTLAVLVVVYRSERTSGSGDLRMALLLSATTLVVPYGFFYDIVFLPLAIVILARRGFRDGFQAYERPVLAAAWLLPLFAGHLHGAGLPAAPLVHLAMLLMILRRARQEGGDFNTLPTINKNCARYSRLFINHYNKNPTNSY